MQFDLYVCLECLDKHEHLLRNLHETSKAAIPEIFQHCCKQIADQLNHVISPMTELENLTSYISIKIKEIKTQKANYVYYMRKGDPVNFLDVIPVKTYVESIKNVRCRLETLSSFLEQYDLMKTYHNRFDTNDLRLALEDIADVSSSDDAQQWSRKKPVYLSPDQNFFPACFDCLTKWRKVFYDGGKWSNEYKKLCVKFTKLNNVQSNVKSKYEDDLQVIAENVPDDMAHEKWRKAVFFKVWNKYENSYK